MKYRTEPLDLRRMFLWALVQNVFLLAITLLVLDGGQMFRATVGGSFGYWLISLAIMTHYDSVERHEIFFVRWGMAVLCVVFGIALI